MKTIKELREEREWTPAQLADKLGVSLATVYNWEGGKTEPRATQFREIAQVFGVPMEEIDLGNLVDRSPSRPRLRR